MFDQAVAKRVIEDVEREFQRAVEMHAPMNSDHEAYAVILEELDEFKQEVWLKRSLRSTSKMRAELIQVAAMAVRAIHDLRLV